MNHLKCNMRIIFLLHSDKKGLVCTETSVSRAKPMSFHARPISFKPVRQKGLSARLIASHYENNYGGAIRRLNAIRGELANLEPASAPGFRLNGLKREEL